MRIQFLHIILALIFVLFQSCEKTEKIENFPKSAPKLVMVSTLSPDSSIRIMLFKSLSILDNAPNKAITSAMVELYRDDLPVSSLATANSGNSYLFQEIPQVGHHYSVKASLPGYESITASTEMPFLVPIQQVSVKLYDTSSWNYYPRYYFGKGKVTIGIEDPGNQENYYMVNMFQYDTSYSIGMNGDTIDMYVYQNFLQNYAYTSDQNIIIEFQENYSYYLSDKFFNGRKFDLELTFGYGSYKPGGTIQLELHSLSREQFLYCKSRSIFNLNDGNPFSEPVKIFTNVENGYGILGGSAFVSSSVDYSVIQK